MLQCMHCSSNVVYDISLFVILPVLIEICSTSPCPTIDDIHICYNSLWSVAGCGEFGYDIASNLSDTAIEQIERMSYADLKRNIEESKVSAFLGVTDDQLNCFGVVFPTDCVQYEAILNQDCLSGLYLKHCYREGSFFPSLNKHPSSLHFMNIYEVDQFYSSLRHNLTKVPVASDAEHKCFGSDFPKGCSSFLGPHTMTCLNTIWLEGCTSQGWMAPSNRTEDQLDAMNNANLYDLLQNVKNRQNRTRSRPPDFQEFLDCLGFEFPKECHSLSGPHSDNCLKALWSRTGCTSEGYYRFTNETVTALKSMMITSIHDYMQDIHDKSGPPVSDSDAILNCYDMVFPNSCVSYYGPHSMNCFIHTWINSGCYSSGKKYPTNLSSIELAYLNKLNLRELISHFNDSAIRSQQNSSGIGDKSAQMDCYGTTLSIDCPAFKAPFTLKCIHYIWKEMVGCSEDGTMFPGSLTQSEIAIRYGTKNLIDIQNEMLYFQQKAELLNHLSQMECYGPNGILAAESFASGINYFAFNHKTDWQGAMQLCQGFWNGTLAMPSTKERHDVIYNTINKATENKSSEAAWLGFSDLDNEGDWKFVNGSTVAMSPDVTQFGPIRTYGLTGYTLLMPSENTISSDGRWHFYFNKSTFGNYQTVRAACHSMGGHLPVIHSLADNNQLEEKIKKFPSQFTGNPSSLEVLTKLYLGMEKSVAGDSRTFTDDEGKPVFMPSEWYTKSGYSLPSSEQLSRFQNWAYPPEPNGLSVGAGSYPNASCATMDSSNGKWYDYNCEVMLQTVCEKGPFSFERWRLGGTKLAEPNNGGGEEDCGAMQLNVDENIGGVTTRLWNDYSCSLQFPFACETVFPEHCSTLSPPHSSDCFETLWNRSNCVNEGYDNPKKLSSTLMLSLTNFNLLFIDQQIKSLSIAADNGNVSAQLKCYGLTYPNGCRSYWGPHSVDCLISIWERTGCLKSGNANPDYLTSLQIQAYDSSHLRSVEGRMQKIHNHAKAGDEQHQLDCFGRIIFVDGCNTFDGPHTMTCFKNLWEKTGCLPSGDHYPEKLDPLQNASLNSFNVVQLAAHMNDIQVRSEYDESAQRDCYGIVFPENCTTFLGPLSGSCLASIWTDIGCERTGSSYPLKLTDSERNLVWKEYNLVEARSQMVDYPLTAANNGDSDEQLKCYGLKFPRGCVTFVGPHSFECQIATWLEAGCTNAEFRFPSTFTTEENKTLNTLNLFQLREFMKDFIAKAEKADNEKHQLDCFGILFPDNCTSYKGPHAINCLNTIWRIVGCMEEGTKYPMILNLEELEYLNKMTVVQVERYMKDLSDLAVALNEQAELDCYGLRLPPTCPHFFGRLPVDCLASIWLGAGCLEKGLYYPSRLTQIERIRIWKNDNIREVRNFVKSLYSKSKLHDSESQLHCYGLVFPIGCTSYEGPHDTTCIASSWIDAGLAAEGFPNRQSKELDSSLDTLNLRRLIDHFRAINGSAINGDHIAQVEGFGMAFYPNCTKYHPPLSWGCLDSIWLNVVGCKRDGASFPHRNTSARFLDIMWEEKNQREAKHAMQVIKDAAVAGDALHIKACYGNDKSMWLYMLSAMGVTVSIVLLVFASLYFMNRNRNRPIWRGDVL